MRRCKTTVIATTLAALIGSAAMSGTPIVYPAKNQTPEQQKKDEGECNAWAKENTGVDPVVLASTPRPRRRQPPHPRRLQGGTVHAREVPLEAPPPVPSSAKSPTMTRARARQ